VRFLAVVCLLAAPLLADRLELKGGGRLDGEIESEDDRAVTLRMPAGSMTIPRSRIARIVREERGDYLRREAGARLAGGSTAVAVGLYERAFRDDPGCKDALAGALAAHAVASIEGFRLDRARAAVARLAEVAPGDARLPALRARLQAEDEKAARLRSEAEREFAEGRFRSGIEALRAWSLRRPPGDPDAARALARAHEAAGADAARTGRLRAALDHFRAARSYGARGDVLAAIEILQPVAALEALREGRGEEARRIIASLARGYPTPGVARYLEAVEDQLGGEMKKAVAGYAEAERIAAEGAGRRAGLPYDVVTAYARTTLRSAIGKPPAEGAKRWAEIYLEPLESSRSGQVTAFAPTGKLAAQVARAADEALRAAASELGLPMPDGLRAEVVIHANDEVYLAADRNPGGTPLGALSASREQTAGVTYATRDEKGPLVRVESFAGQPSLFASVLPHEMVHVAQHNGFGAFRRAHWLDEGVAMLAESEAVRAHRLAWLRKSTRLFSLTELLALRSTPPDEAFLFYNQAYALTAYVRGLGTGQEWRAFLDRVATREIPAALRETYGIGSLDELERGFLSATGLSR